MSSFVNIREILNNEYSKFNNKTSTYEGVSQNSYFKLAEYLLEIENEFQNDLAEKIKLVSILFNKEKDDIFFITAELAYLVEDKMTINNTRIISMLDNMWKNLHISNTLNLYKEMNKIDESESKKPKRAERPLKIINCLWDDFLETDKLENKLEQFKIQKKLAEELIKINKNR